MILSSLPVSITNMFVAVACMNGRTTAGITLVLGVVNPVQTKSQETMRRKNEQLEHAAGVYVRKRPGSA